MGAFIIADIKFETEKDRVKFEHWLKINDKNIICDEQSDSGGFCAWTIARDPLLNPIYNLGFMGYEDVKKLLKSAFKKNIKIKFFAWIPINDKNSSWKKEFGRW